jgi:hypothetical protein
VRGVPHHPHFQASKSGVDGLGIDPVSSALAETRCWGRPSFQNPTLLLHGWAFVSVGQPTPRPIHSRQRSDDEFQHQGGREPRSGTPKGLFGSPAQSVGEAIPQRRLGRPAPSRKVPKATGDVVTRQITREIGMFFYIMIPAWGRINHDDTFRERTYF